MARIADLGESELNSTEAALDALEKDCGSGTPDEDFVTTVLALYAAKKLSPSSIETYAKEYRHNFESAAQDARGLFQRHPELMQVGGAE